jgi:hypothetical protein
VAITAPTDVEWGRIAAGPKSETNAAGASLVLRHEQDDGDFG